MQKSKIQKFNKNNKKLKKFKRKKKKFYRKKMKLSYKTNNKKDLKQLKQKHRL